MYVLVVVVCSSSRSFFVGLGFRVFGVSGVECNFFGDRGLFCKLEGSWLHL